MSRLDLLTNAAIVRLPSLASLCVGAHSHSLWVLSRSFPVRTADLTPIRDKGIDRCKGGEFAARPPFRRERLSSLS